MTEEALAEVSTEALPAETPQDAPIDAPAVNTEVEDKARRMGWKPEAEYKGDPNRWTDAESFVKVGEERIPVMKENYRKLEDKYTNLEQQVKQQREYQEHMGKVQYERAMKELKAEQKEAVEDADTEKFEQLEQRKEQIKVDYSPKQSTQPQKPNEVADWEARNTWYQNPTLADKAIKLEQRIMSEEAYKQSRDFNYKPMILSERLEEVTRRVQADFAPKEQPRRLPAVEGTRVASAKAAAKTWSDISPEHAEAANSMVKTGLLSKAEYLKDYFGE